jgi:hypothetical protein
MGMYTPNVYTSLNSKFFPVVKVGSLSVPSGASSTPIDLYFFPGKEYINLGKLVLTPGTGVTINQVKLFYELPPSAWGPANRIAETDILPAMTLNGTDLQIDFSDFGTGGNIEAAVTGVSVVVTSSSGGTIGYKVLVFVPLFYYVS